MHCSPMPVECNDLRPALGYTKQPTLVVCEDGVKCDTRSVWHGPGPGSVDSVPSMIRQRAV